MKVLNSYFAKFNRFRVKRVTWVSSRFVEFSKRYQLTTESSVIDQPLLWANMSCREPRNHVVPNPLQSDWKSIKHRCEASKYLLKHIGRVRNYNSRRFERRIMKEKMLSRVHSDGYQFSSSQIVFTSLSVVQLNPNICKAFISWVTLSERKERTQKDTNTRMIRSRVWWIKVNILELKR